MPDYEKFAKSAVERAAKSMHEREPYPNQHRLAHTRGEMSEQETAMIRSSGEVALAIEALNRAANNLEKDFHLLKERLAMVVRQMPESNQDSPEAGPETTVPLASQIQTVSLHLMWIHQRFVDLAESVSI